MNTFAILKSIPPWMLLSVGVLAGWVKSFWSTIYGHTIGYVVRKLHVSLTIEDDQHQEAYRWLTFWSEKKLFEQQISSVLLRRKVDQEEDASGFELIPAYGTYYLRWRRRYMMVLTHAKTNNRSGDDTAPAAVYGDDKHSFKVSIWGTLDRKVLLDVVWEAKAEYEASHPEMLYYYTNGSGSGYGAHWYSSLLLRRPLETIYLPGDQISAILHDIQAFFDAKDKYPRVGYSMAAWMALSWTSRHWQIVAHCGAVISL